MSSEEDEILVKDSEPKQKVAAKAADDVNSTLLTLSSSEDEEQEEYTDIFADQTPKQTPSSVGEIVQSAPFEEGESVSISDDEVEAYTGDTHETYIGGTQEEAENEVKEEKLIEISDENVKETVEKLNETEPLTVEKLNKTEPPTESLVAEIADKLETVKLLPPGKPVKVITEEEESQPNLLLDDNVQAKGEVDIFDLLAQKEESPQIKNTMENNNTDLGATIDNSADLGSRTNHSSHSNTVNEDPKPKDDAGEKKILDNKVKKRRKRPRHRIYLDDPDIHQLISEQVDILKQILAGVTTTASRAKSPSQPPDISFAGVKQRATPGQAVRSSNRIHVNNRTSSYKPHKARGKNLITRIRNDNYNSSSSDEDDPKHNPYEVCPDCGERHSADEDDEDVCPDCGVAHNPYQHSPVKQMGVVPCKTHTKHGKRYEQISAEQDPEEVKEDLLPSIEGPLTVDQLTAGYRYRLKFLGSCQIVTQHPVTKETRIQQAQDAYNRIKVDDDDEDEVTTNVDMQISLQRIKIINVDTKHEDVMMDHALRTVCFICDMGKVLVLMARRLTSENSTDFSIENGKPITLGNIVGEQEKRTSKNVCHVFEGEEDASVIAKAIGQAFNVAYRQFLQSNGISHEHVEEAEYCHVLESQKLVGTDLDKLTDQSAVRDVVVVKKRGDPLGVMLLESGWGSMLPTVFVAHIANYSAVARNARIAVGDHVLACNGVSLVGLPLSECTAVLRGCRSSDRVTFRIVTCPPVVDVVVSRPDVKYQLGFSVQNGTICSLLRGGIAERGGVRVGHRIIEINGDSVVAKAHQHIVDILANTTGTISMKTMPIAMYRLMVGEDQPQHV